MALVTLSEMKDYLGISDTSYDAFLTSQIELVSSAVEHYCGRKFEEATYKQTFYKEEYVLKDGSSKELELASYPIISITSVKELADKTDLVGTEVTEYRQAKDLGLLKHDPYGRFFSYGPIIEVEYIAGYSEIPVLVKSVVLNVVQERYNKKVNGIDLNFGTDIQRISIPGTIGIDFDYTLQNNERKSAFGTILGSNANVLDFFRSERAVIGDVQIIYVD